MGYPFRSPLIVVGLTVSLSACGYAEWPPRDSAPRDANPSRPSMNAQSSSAQAFRNASAVVVGKGDTVYALSRRHGVSMRAIIQANGLAAPFHLRIGQRVVLPRDPEHKVVKGDTLSAIALRYDAGLHELARLNDLNSPYTIFIGQKLRLPGRGSATVVASSPVTSSAKPAPTAKPKATTKPPKPPAWSTPSPATRAADASNAKTSIVRNSRPAASRAIPKPPPRSGKGFLWPVQGRVLSNFGAKPKGFHNDGINIAAAKGAPIQAAQNGVVVYAGNELRGFGNLLLIKHRDGYVTAYAHADRLLVKRGDQVRKGQRIATVGTTGSVTRPQLHFEIRKGRRARDPKKYLRRA